MTTQAPAATNDPEHGRGHLPLGGWTLAILSLAGLKIVLALVATVLPGAGAALTPFPWWIGPANIVVFAGTGALLIVGGRERRALDLGCYLLLFASTFSDRLALSLPQVVPSSAGLVTVLVGLHPDAFLPVYLWRFFRAFPDAVSVPKVNRLADVLIRLAVASGLVLFGVNAWSVLGSNAAALPGALDFLLRWPPDAHYWTIIILLLLPTLPFAVWKMRFAPEPERRRVRLFLSGLLVGSLPITVDVLLESLIPGFREFMTQTGPRLVSGLIVYPFLLSIPLTTAYAVLVQRVLDVRLVLRKALQHALGRYGVLTLVAIPAIGLTAYLYQHRHEPLALVLQGPRALVLVALLLAFLWMLRVRHSLYDSLDRRFFREQYDARSILAELVDKSRVAATVEELASLLQSEIDRALHLNRIAVFLLQPASGRYAPTAGPHASLSASSRLAALLAGAPEPLDIDPADQSSVLRRLPAVELAWLQTGGFRLLLPLLGTGDALLGLVALGQKRSDLPFSREDRLLLGAIAASGALTLENRLMRSTPGGAFAAEPLRPALRPDAADEPAMECVRCRMVLPPAASSCASCGGNVEAAPVPCVLAGKFHLERRVGAGGMGIVYRAMDIELQRPVAIKTLPRLSPERAARMKREARAVARLIHPNLALIFGAETWRGVPMLVFEFLEGGTLADRLSNGPLSPMATVDLGLVLADVLLQAHQAGILHRDVKPSNIGFTRPGVPKLLDFGLAHLLDAFAPEALATGASGDVATTSLRILPLAHSGEGHIVGTPLYLSPEAIAGQRPDASFDLWSVTMVLYECIVGAHPISGRNVFETLDRISRVDIPDVSDTAPDCPPALAQLLRAALSPDPRERPLTARDLAARLRAVRDALG